MLRILDARTGEPVAAAPARRGLTRIEAYASGPDPTALRVLLTADLLVRALELGGTPVWAILTAPHRPAELRTAATTLAIHPFEDGRDLASGLGEAQVIHVVAQDAQDPPGEGPLLTVAPVTWTGTAGQGEAGAVDGEEVVDGEAGKADAGGPGAGPAGPDAAPLRDLAALLADPTALRLSLLSVPRGTPVRLDPAGLAEAARTLAGWRRAVAGWSRQPSRPVPEEVRVRLRAAWEDDLDLPGVLAVLRDVADAPELPDGARFETYVYADRLLALELARDVGSLA